MSAEVEVFRDYRGKGRSRCWEEVARVAAEQWGVVSLSQLQRAGLSPDAIFHRRRSGQLHPLHRGVYAVGHPHLERNGRFLAAVLAMGDGALLTHRSATVRWGLLEHHGDEIDVTVPRKATSRAGIRVHTAHLSAHDTLPNRAIPITTPTRTVLDLAATPLPDRALRRAVNEALVQRLTSVPALHRALKEATPRRGTRRLAALLETAQPTDSGLEDELLVLCAAHDIPAPRTQHRIGPYRVDAFFPDHNLVVEVDGGRYHDTPLRRADDRLRDAFLERAGCHVVHISDDEVAERPGVAADRIRRGLRSARPRC